MGTNRKLKTDGNLEIESSQVDINSDIDVAGDVGSTTLTTSGNATVGGDIDVTGDVGGATATITGDASVGGNASVTGNVSCVDVDATGDLGGATSTITGNATVGGTLGVTGQSTLSGLAYPTSDGTNGQAIITNGSGTLSFGDVASGGGGGVDEITSASEALSYSGTNRIIHITATEAVTFNDDLKDKIIFMSEEFDLKFKDCFVDNCIIRSFDDVIFETTSSDGSTDTVVRGTTVDCYGDIEFRHTGTSTSNGFTVQSLRASCIQFKATNINTSLLLLSDSYINCAYFYSSGTLTTAHVQLGYSSVETGFCYGYIKCSSSMINASRGGSSSNNCKIEIGSTVHIDSVYPYPFKVDSSGVDTNVVLYCKLSTNQAITTNNPTKIVFNSEVIDNTSSFASGTFTAKVKGFYKVNTNVYTNSLGTTNSNQIEVRSPSNSDIYAYVNGGATADSSSNRQSSFGVILELEVGEIVEIFTDSFDSSYSINATSNLSIEKIN